MIVKFVIFNVLSYSFWVASLQEIEGLLINSEEFGALKDDLMTKSTFAEDVFGASPSQQQGDCIVSAASSAASEVGGSRMKYALNF